MRAGRQRPILLALLFVVGSAIGWFLPNLTSNNSGKPLGRSIPTEPPNEVNRISHRLGFSLVYPPNWAILVTDGPLDPSINGYPRSLIPSRRSGIINIARLSNREPDLSGLRLIEFQGEPACEHISRRPGNWNDPPQFL